GGPGVGRDAASAPPRHTDGRLAPGHKHWQRGSRDLGQRADVVDLDGQAALSAAGKHDSAGWHSRGQLVHRRLLGRMAQRGVVAESRITRLCPDQVGLGERARNVAANTGGTNEQLRAIKHRSNWHGNRPDLQLPAGLSEAPPPTSAPGLTLTRSAVFTWDPPSVAGVVRSGRESSASEECRYIRRGQRILCSYTVGNAQRRARWLATLTRPSA